MNKNKCKLRIIIKICVTLKKNEIISKKLKI